MLLSKRERPPDNVSTPSNNSSSISYRRTSIPSISPVVVVSSASASNIPTTRRTPLAPLDPQVAASMPLDNQASTPSSSSSSSYHGYPSSDTGKDGDRTLETARAFIGRPIMNRSQEEDPSLSPQSLRKRSLSGQSSSVRASPYPNPRAAQRRPSNTPSASDPRRPSLPNILYPPPSPSTVGLPSPPHHATTLTDIAAHSTPPYSFNEDLYSGLSTFTFGAAQPLPSPHTSDSSDMISPLTRVSGTGSADRTPRPSVSSASSGRHKSRILKVNDPDEGDDEYEDDDDVQRGKTRSKMRAIDDGSRRPSLPTNAFIPNVSTDSVVPIPPSAPGLELSPGGSSASESAYDDSEADQDEGDVAEFDTDVELDLPHGLGLSRGHDPPVSDTASQHTFGAGSFDHYGTDSHHSDDRLSILDDEEDGNSISPVLFTRDQDDEAFDDGDRPLPSLPSQRKSSLPWDVPVLPGREGGPSSNRDREDSAATVTARRASRSIDDDLKASTIYPDVQPSSHPQIDFDPQTPLGAPSDQGDQYEYGEYNLDYILGDSSTRRSWSSGAPSFQGSRRKDTGDPSSLGAIWDAALPGSRRPSTATVNSGDDPFSRQVNRWDPDYGTRKGDWSFKKESSDGRGPHRMPLVPTTSADGSVVTMQPGTQELWRQAYVGRFKVDRVKMSTDQPAKAPQQRLNIRHIHDPYSKGNTRGGPGSVIHKHSRAIAFSIFRNHSLFSRSQRSHKQPMHTSSSILLANKKVQEQYTSTRTTSKLNSHGLLEDVGTMGTSTYSQSRTMVASVSNRSRPSTPRQPTDGSQSEGYASDQRAQSSKKAVSPPAESSSQASAHPPPVPQKTTSSHSSALSSSSVDVPETIRTSADASSFTYGGDADSSLDRSSSFTSQSGTSRIVSRRSSVDVDDEDSPPRTSHAEAFATVDSAYFEHLRARSDRRHAEEPSSHGLVGVIRRKLLGSNKGVSKPQATLPPAIPREGHYTPPWLTMAPRSKQEERERVIQNLNESFKDVGLLPTARVPKQPVSKTKPKHPNTTTIFEKVPADSLYMLLPLWPGETDPTSSETREDPASYFVPVEERQYLLVYYVPFDEDKGRDKRSDSHKKRTRADTRSLTTVSSTSPNERTISLRSFKAVARLVSYADLRQTGVRVPAFGLSVTGPLKEATQYLPPPYIREQRLDDIVIGVCYSRNMGIEFVPEGLQKLGLCMPTETPPRQTSDELDEEEEDVVLTPIGRAAVEMAWLGCMAVTSFGST